MWVWQITLALGFPHGFDISPKVIERRRDFFLARGEVFVQSFPARSKPFVEMQVLDLQCQTAVYIIHGQSSRRRVFGLHNVEEVGIGVFVKESKVRSLGPRIYPIEVEIRSGIAFDIGVVGVR